MHFMNDDKNPIDLKSIIFFLFLTVLVQNFSRFEIRWLQ